MKLMKRAAVRNIPPQVRHCAVTPKIIINFGSYCAIVFSFALLFANGWFTACDGFYGASAYWLSHMKQ